MITKNIVISIDFLTKICYTHKKVALRKGGAMKKTSLCILLLLTVLASAASCGSSGSTNNGKKPVNGFESKEQSTVSQFENSSRPSFSESLEIPTNLELTAKEGEPANGFVWENN